MIPLLLCTFHAISSLHSNLLSAFSALAFSVWHCWLTLLVVICLQRGADCLHMVQLMPLHPKIPSSLASFNSRLILPFWYSLTQVVLEKRPLSGCVHNNVLFILLVRSVNVCFNSQSSGGIACPCKLLYVFSKTFNHIGIIRNWWRRQISDRNVDAGNLFRLCYIVTL